MPCLGYVCPPGAPTAGEHHTVEHCISECAHPCASPPLIAAIHHANAVNHHQGAYVSASMLASSNCRRQVMYERFDEQGFYRPLLNTYWPFRGTIAHQVIEERGGLTERIGWMQEIRMSVPLVFGLAAPVYNKAGEWTGKYDKKRPLVMTLGGTCDAYNPYARKLHDYKTMADAKVDKLLGGEQQQSWVEQLNIYRWLISQTPIGDAHRARFAALGLPPLPGDRFPAPTELRIQAVGMMNFPLTGTQYAKQVRGQTVLYDVPDIPVWELSDTEAFIRERALDWYRVLVQRVVPPVVPAGLSWLCKSCPFNGEAIPGERCHPAAERAQ